MYLVNESSKHEPVKRVYKTREKSQSLLDHPRKDPILGTHKEYNGENEFILISFNTFSFLIL